MNFNNIKTSGKKDSQANEDKIQPVFKIFKDRYFWFLLTLIVIFTSLVYAPLINILMVSNFDMHNSTVYHIALYRTIFIIIAALCTWRYNTKSGIITCLVLATAIFISYAFNIQKETSIFLDIGLLALGIIFCLLIGKILDFQKLLRQNTNKLKIQALKLKEEIAERNKAENEVRTSEKKYRLLAENISDVIWMVNFDSPEKPNYISPSVINLLGYSVEEAMQKRLDEITTPDSYIYAGKILGEILDNKTKNNKINFYDTELELKHKNGKIIPFDVSFNLLRQPRGKPAGIMIIAHDVSERKQTEEKILHIAEEWQATFDSISSMISIHDKNFRITRVNKAFADYFKSKPEKFIGKLCYEVMHDLCEPIDKCPHKITVETKKTPIWNCIYLKMKNTFIFLLPLFSIKTTN